MFNRIDLNGFSGDVIKIRERKHDHNIRIGATFFETEVLDRVEALALGVVAETAIVLDTVIAIPATLLDILTARKFDTIHKEATRLSCSRHLLTIPLEVIVHFINPRAYVKPSRPKSIDDFSRQEGSFSTGLGIDFDVQLTNLKASNSIWEKHFVSRGKAITALLVISISRIVEFVIGVFAIIVADWELAYDNLQVTLLISDIAHYSQDALFLAKNKTFLKANPLDFNGMSSF